MNKDFQRLHRIIDTVLLNCVGEHYDVLEVEFLNIESDIMGRDVMTFVCPKCKQVEKSYVFCGG